MKILNIDQTRLWAVMEKKSEFNGTFVTQFLFNILKCRDSFNSITRTVFN